MKLRNPAAFFISLIIIMIMAAIFGITVPPSWVFKDFNGICVSICGH